jgi:hypothetical protein
VRWTGRRGAFLAVLGVYDLFYGWFLFAGGALQRAPLLGEHTWGIIWLVTGVVLVAGSSIRRHDRLFFTAASLVKTAWAAEFLRLALIGVPYDWARTGYWAAFAALVIVAAGWPDPPHLTPPVTVDPVGDLPPDLRP